MATATNGRKTTCPISRRNFRAGARSLCVTIEGRPLVVDVKEFSTGSFGWYHNGKTTVVIDGTAVMVQLGLTLTVVGSKELPQE